MCLALWLIIRGGMNNSFRHEKEQQEAKISKILKKRMIDKAEKESQKADFSEKEQQEKTNLCMKSPALIPCERQF